MGLVEGADGEVLTRTGALILRSAFSLLCGNGRHRGGLKTVEPVTSPVESAQAAVVGVSLLCHNSLSAWPSDQGAVSYWMIAGIRTLVWETHVFRREVGRQRAFIVRLSLVVFMSRQGARAMALASAFVRRIPVVCGNCFV